MQTPSRPGASKLLQDPSHIFVCICELKVEISRGSSVEDLEDLREVRILDGRDLASE
jgi:hypothetical protein